MTTAGGISSAIAKSTHLARPNEKILLTRYLTVTTLTSTTAKSVGLIENIHKGVESMLYSTYATSKTKL
jgi:hypothetical protein